MQFESMKMDTINYNLTTLFFFHHINVIHFFAFIITTPMNSLLCYMLLRIMERKLSCGFCHIFKVAFLQFALWGLALQDNH